MTTRNPETLESRIEQLVRDHLAAQQVAARAAVERAFATVMAAPVVLQGRARFARRPAAQMAEVAERLFAAVQACPGETMTVIAARMGEKPPALNRPMVHLKRAGRVRSAGERNFTRYFPMAATKSA